ncbi:hypothetical protein [Nannocystis pusilla]|uniref:Bacterial HORMA domain-containing protein n=1 Tax=Nannocystis pusilla TaxID=889268 RepID=A0ABS7U090_9BACT|nr:hypothetical protein [Nannocystis pusilla]MBZ5713785.1 hypothetical protein [Nannocystis pusilla]
MASTYTTTEASTFTEARARAVMISVLGDFTALKNAGLITAAQAEEWHDALLFALCEEAVEMFQLKFTSPTGQQRALDYEVKDDGSISASQRPGGINYLDFATGTTVGITLRLRPNGRGREKVLQYLQRRRWGMDGKILTGNTYVDRQYSQSGYGLTRKKVGEWT